MSKGVRVIRYIIIGLVVLLLLGLALLRVGWGIQRRGARRFLRRELADGGVVIIEPAASTERRGTGAYADIDL